MSTTSKTPLLDTIKIPADLRSLQPAQMKQVADELRAEVIDAVSVTGGHLGAGLGVVELTVAIHYLFDTPDDRLIWDVGHQCYPHKILTGRRDRIRTLRRAAGFRALPSGPSPNMTRSVPGTARPRSRPGLAWRLPISYPMTNAKTSLP